MKPLFEKVLLSKSSFGIKEEHFDWFDIQWHIHPEFELSYLFHGEGIITVGDYISKIENDKILLFGPNLPHGWYGNASGKTSLKSKQIIIQFPYDFLGRDFFDNNSMLKIRELLTCSNRGLCFYGSEIRKIAGKIRKMFQVSDFERTIELLEILHILSQSKHFSSLSSIGYSQQLNEYESVRLNSIYKFILGHFKDHIDLNTVSEYVNMTPQAFSKYFKERTRKNFTVFLNEVKIGHACRLINEKKLNFSQICYECGYSNLSNFNRQFKRTMQQTPSQYASQFK